MEKYKKNIFSKTSNVLKEKYSVTRLCLVLAVFLLIVGCLQEKSNTIGDNGDDHEDTPDTIILLSGTSWKLVGITDVQTGLLTELEPTDCDECYTLTFDTDTTFSGTSTTNLLLGIYMADYITSNICISNIGGTEVGEYGHGYTYLDALLNIQSFSIKDADIKKLHLFYNDNKTHLEYKEIGGQK